MVRRVVWAWVDSFGRREKGEGGRGRDEGGGGGA